MQSIKCDAINATKLYEFRVIHDDKQNENDLYISITKMKINLKKQPREY